MPQRLKFFALFAVISLFPLGFAKDYDKGDKEKKSVDFEVDGSIRYRYEYWQNHPFVWIGLAFPNFGYFSDLAYNSNYINWHLLRSRIGVKASLDDDKFAYVQIQDARTFGNDALYGYQGEFGTPDLHNYGEVDNFGITQAYLQVERLWETPFGLKIGRQFLKYGAEKLVGDDDWSNFGQSFDAVKLLFRQDYFEGDLFYAELWPWYPVGGGIPGISFDFANVSFFGFHGMAKYHKNHDWSAYIFGYRDGNLSFPILGGPILTDPFEAPVITDTNKTLLWTLGTRVEGEFPFGLGYAGEFAVQFGDWYQTAASGFMSEFEVWQEFKKTAGRPYWGVGFTFASGDDSADGDKNTLVRLFPSPHSQLGYMDLTGMQNITSFDFKAGISPVEELSLNGALHLFRLNEKRDAWYGAYGSPFGVLGLGPLGFGMPGRDSLWTSKDLGSELDLFLKYKYDGGLWFKGGWSVFFPGKALDNYAIKTPYWVYLQTGLDF